MRRNTGGERKRAQLVCRSAVGTIHNRKSSPQRHLYTTLESTPLGSFERAAAARCQNGCKVYTLWAPAKFYRAYQRCRLKILSAPANTRLYSAPIYSAPIHQSGPLPGLSNWLKAVPCQTQTSHSPTAPVSATHVSPIYLGRSPQGHCPMTHCP